MPDGKGNEKQFDSVRIAVFLYAGSTPADCLKIIKEQHDDT